LRDRLDVLTAGRGGVAILSGEAGIGKTSLLDELLHEANTRGVLTLVGKARELERDRPFAAVADLVDAAEFGALAELADALRPSEGLAMADRTLVVADALVDAVETEAPRAGLVLAFEDIHWADPGTVAVLGRVARSVPTQPILLIVTMRPTPARRDLQLTLDDMKALGAITVPVGALTDDAVDELVRRRAGRPPTPRLREHFAACSGNPFYVIELLSALEEEDALDSSAATVDLRSDVRTVPASARAALVRHLGFLPVETRRLLQIAAVLGESFSANDLALVTDRPVSELLEHLDVALHSELIVDAGHRWTFRHDLVRQSLEEGLAPTARKALHREVAAALGRGASPAAVVARHLALGAEPGDREAIAGLRAAAAEALRSSIPVGIELLEAALDLTVASDPERIALVADVLEPLNASGRPAEAEALGRGVLGAALSVTSECSIVHALGSSLYARGDVAGAIDVIAPLLARADVVGAPRAMLHSAMAVYSMLRLDLGAMAFHADAATQAAATSDDHYAIGLAANTVAMSLLTQGRAGDALAPAIVGRERVVAGSVYSWAAYNPPLTLSLIALERDDLDGATALLNSGRIELEACGNVSWLVQYASIDAIVAYVTGDLERTEDACRVAQQLPLEFGPRYQQGVPAALLAIVAWRRGDDTAAAMYAEEAERHYLEFGPQLGIDLAWLASALVKEASGDVAGAYEMLRLAWELTDPIHAFVSWRLLAPEVARLAIDRDPAFATKLADEVVELARRNPVPSAEGTAAYVQALAERDTEQIVAAVALLERSPRRLATADAATNAVRMLRAAGRPDEATAFYERARGRYLAAGSHGDLDRLRRAAGLRRTGVVARPTAGWDSLTRSEREVVALLQDGLTNRQIGDALGISRRTVETHLSHAFTKVGVATRVQLAAEAARRG
jgi:DNA-binding CsgD family transcriptional regulator